MGYRFPDNPPKPEDRLMRFDVRNGAIMRVTFGCYYSDIHNRPMHDHLGWPEPRHPDRICQVLPNPLNRHLKNKRVIEFDPIHLAEEGYTEAVVTYEDSNLAEHLQTTAWIDDYLVKMKVHADFDTFSDKPIDARFTIFIKDENGSVIDAVCHGIVTVLPGSPIR